MASVSGSVFVSLTERSLVGAARRRASALADSAGLDDAAVGRLAVVVTELANNALAHAREGELFARVLHDGRGGGIEVTVVDRGPGIPDVERAMADGYTTASSAGTGLGAVARMADDFQLHSLPGEGTVAVAVVAKAPGASGASVAEPVLGALVRPHPHEERCGDAWGVRREADRVVVAMVDGLGHGPEAGDAAIRAVRSFESDGWEGTEAAVSRMHDALRRTRGAVGGVLEMDGAEGRVLFTGVGNVAASIVDAREKQSLVSMNGTLGMQSPPIREYEYRCRPGCVAVLHTDGISARWGLERVAALIGRSPSLICGAVYLDRYRRRDDAAVLAVRAPSDGVGRNGS